MYRDEKRLGTMADVGERADGARVWAMVAAAADGLLAVDRGGRVVFASPAMDRIFARDPGSLVGQPLDSLFVPGVLADHRQLIHELLEGHGESGTLIETVGQRGDGSAVPVEIALSTARTEEDELLLVASVRDLSRRDQAHRNRQSHKLEALGSLAAGIAHDFNNMLGAIMGYASAMTREVDESHRHHSDAQQILTIARRAKRLTDKLLAFSRRSDRKIEVFSLNRVVRDVVGLLGRTIPKNIVFKTKLAKNTNTEGERTQIEQVLLNICLNSRDALPAGGEIYIQTQRLEFSPAAAKPLGLTAGTYNLLTVRDNGVGMDAETLSRAFDPFFTTKPAGEGSGLGLFLVYSSVQHHGGQVRINSEVGNGTDVTLFLPATDAQPTPEHQIPSDKQIHGHGETILLVDDERHLRDMAKRLLEGLGYEVLLAESGEEAEAIYRERHTAIDLVILDVVMAGLSGVETLRRLKQVDPAVRVLVSSGHSCDGEPKQLIHRGVCGFIQKPYGIEEVSEAIRRALAGQPV